MAVNPVHPLGPPVLDGTEITVDEALQQPTRITQTIMDLSLRKFLLDKVFSNGGAVTGGAVIYDEAVENELYTARDVEPIAPGGEYPLIDGERRAPKIAPVEKWGGKVNIFDEARDRNDSGLFSRKIRQLTNTIIRKNDARAMETLDAAVTAHSRTIEGTDWSKVVTAGSEASSAEDWPIADFAKVMEQSEVDELGIEFGLVILNPQEWGQLVTIYGGVTNLKAMLSDLGFDYFVSNRQTAGKAKFVAPGQVGGYRVEKPLTSFTYRNEDNDQTLVKASVRPVSYVDNPFAIIEVTKLAG